jgi:hypothetical protein
MVHKAIDQFRPQSASDHQVASETHSLIQAASIETAIAEADLPKSDFSKSSASESAEETTDTPSENLAPEKTQHQKIAELFAQVTSKLGQGAKALGTPLVWLGLVAFCGGTGVAAINWLTDVPANPNCQQIWFFSSDAERLFCAEQAARSGSPSALVAGLKLIEPWYTNHTLEKPAKRLMRDWSKTVLTIARQKAGQNNLKQAIYLVSKIPATSPFYKDAQQALTRWQKSQVKGKALEDSIESALKNQDWQKAEALLLPFANQQDDYWQQQYIRMQERMMTERLSYNQLQAIRAEVGTELTQSGGKLGAAIAKLEELHPKTYARTLAANDVIVWRKALSALATRQLAQGDLTGAIASAKWLPDQFLSPDLQNLTWSERATQLSRQMPAAIPSEENFWQLGSTLSVLRHIQPGNPLYLPVQSKISPLEARLQDLTQLHVAKFVANIQPLPLLPIAIQMAQEITPDRPHRLYAQTLISVWQQDQQQIRDRANIIAAEKFAALNTPQSLNTAIAYASQVSLGQPLRPTAQAAIFDWKQRLLDIEDQAVLNQAQKLATQKQYPEAIQLANKIGDGRPLYQQAQTLVQQWSIPENVPLVEDRF